MEVLLYRDEGEFNLPKKFYTEYAKHYGIKLYFYVDDYMNNRWNRIEEFDVSDNDTYVDIFTEDFGEYFEQWGDEQDKADFYNILIDEHFRDNAVTISIMKDLCKENNYWRDKYKFVEIPVDAHYKIENHGNGDTLYWSLFDIHEER